MLFTPRQFMRETDLVRFCIDYLNIRGHYCWRNQSGKIFMRGVEKNYVVNMGTAGSADIIGIHKGTGKLLAVECKVGKNKTTQLQELFLDKIKELGGIALVVYSQEDLDKQLEPYKTRR